MPDLSIAFLLFPQVTQLDLTGPAQVLSRLGRAKLDLVWKTRAPVATDAGFSIVPTATFDEIPAADILCVPGGMGVTAVIEDDQAMAWVRRVGEGATWVTSVCTGSLILGAAGLLRGYKATTHWAWNTTLPRPSTRARRSAPGRSWSRPTAPAPTGSRRTGKRSCAPPRLDAARRGFS